MEEKLTHGLLNNTGANDPTTQYQQMAPLVFYDSTGQPSFPHHSWETEHLLPMFAFNDITTCQRQQQTQQPQQQYQDRKPNKSGRRRSCRESHNNIERRRRLRIKQCCDVLRTLVPGLSGKTDKASVLEQTVEFVRRLSASGSGQC